MTLKWLFPQHITSIKTIHLVKEQMKLSNLRNQLQLWLLLFSFPSLQKNAETISTDSTYEGSYWEGLNQAALAKWSLIKSSFLDAEKIYIYIYVPSFLIYYESLLILTALPKINLSENVLFISEAEDICIVFLLFVLCCLGISHVHIRGLELQEMGRLTAGTHCTHKEHMWTGCITKCDSTIRSDFGNTNMVWAHVDPF